MGLNHGISGLSLKHLKAKFPNNPNTQYHWGTGPAPGPHPYMASALPIHSYSGPAGILPAVASFCPPLPAPALIITAGH